VVVVVAGKEFNCLDVFLEIWRLENVLMGVWLFGVQVVISAMLEIWAVLWVSDPPVMRNEASLVMTTPPFVVITDELAS